MLKILNDAFKFRSMISRRSPNWKKYSTSDPTQEDIERKIKEIQTRLDKLGKKKRFQSWEETIQHLNDKKTFLEDQLEKIKAKAPKKENK
ncbi:unnamed protein product [Nezara viridula]|uniref:Uncharacterized protein n=1 Tax=Nezara viridula TaxID=85310 RepID=A0A9P0HHM8_NEZVI|nr:unnamed protein product [Nezara viridula]